MRDSEGGGGLKSWSRHLAATGIAAAALWTAPAGATSAVVFDGAFGGGDGVRILQPALGATSFHINDVAVAGDGAIWVAGSVLVGGDFDMYACRVDASGGGHSCVVLPFDLGGTQTDFGAAIAVDAGGKAVLFGTASGPAGDTEARIAAVRLTAGVALDPSFGGDGRVDLALTGPVTISQVAILADERVAFVGSLDQDVLGIPDKNVLVGRLLANGGWDPSFDSNGRRVVPFNLGGDNADSGVGLALASDGGVVVAATVRSGAGSTAMALARITAGGALDPAFDGDGLVVVPTAASPIQYASGVAFDRRGRIVIAGKVQGVGVNDAVGLARYDGHGVLDPAFGVGGLALHEVGAAAIVGVVGPIPTPGPAGSALVVGNFQTGLAGDPTDTYILRTDRDGEADAGWGSGTGYETDSVVPSVANPDARFHGAAFQQSRLIVIGTQFGDNFGFVARLRMDDLFADDFEGGSVAAWSASAGAP